MMSDELKRAYEMVQKDLQDKDVYCVRLFGDGSTELSTSFETGSASEGESLYEAVKNLACQR